MAVQNVIVQCLDESETRLAERTLRKNGPVSTSQAGVYVRGYADDRDIEELEGLGLLVERIPESPPLCGMKPGKETEPGPDPLVAEGEETPRFPIQEEVARAAKLYVVQLKGPLRGEWRTPLEEIGVSLDQYIPDFAFRTPLTEEQYERVKALDFVERMFLSEELQPLRALQAAEPAEPARHGEESISFGMAGEPTRELEETAEGGRYEVLCQEPENAQQIAALLESDSRTSDVWLGTYKVQFSCTEGTAVLGELRKLKQNGVVMVGEVPKFELLNSYVRAALGVEPSPPEPALPWNGANVLVGVADSGVDESHPDLANSVEQVLLRPGATPGDADGHGTHVCGTIAGDGSQSGGTLRGVATGARLIVQALQGGSSDLRFPKELSALFQEAYDLEVRIHNDSWGFRRIADEKVAGRYLPSSYEVDKFIYEHPDFLAVFAAGNEGVQAVSDPPDPLGQIDLFSLTAPATAKNVLTVGACCSSRTDGPYADKPWSEYPNGPQNPKVANEKICGDLEVLAAFSSRGPSHDERIKPELVAPGTVVLSTRSSQSEPNPRYIPFDDYYIYISGTSMAAPAVAGAAAIVRQHYLERGHQPSAALLKATLINGTVWINTEVASQPEVGQPNYHQGFGRLDLRKVLPVPGNTSGLRLLFADVPRESSQALDKSDSQRGRWRRTVHVEPGLPLRVTLAWTDLPGPGLQQDLDLLVLAPGNKRIAGNHAMIRSLGQAHDRRNNVEQVLLEAPEAGVYQIHVLAYSTPFGSQGFSLAVTGKLTSELLP